MIVLNYFRRLVELVANCVSRSGRPTGRPGTEMAPPREVALDEGGVRLRAQLRSAIAAEPGAPPALVDTIRRELRRDTASRVSRLVGRREFAFAACATLVVAAGVGTSRLLRRGAQPAEPTAIALGLDHHRHCATVRPEPIASLDRADMRQAVGPFYAALVDEVAAAAPADTLVDAHCCSGYEREFVHFRVRGSGRTSVLLTRTEGASAYDGRFERAVAPAGDTCVCRIEGHTLFVISEPQGADAEALARRLAPVFERRLAGLARL